MTLPEFQEFQKIPRLSRDVIITEKIDGTNAQIFITEDGDLFCGSRNRWITPSDDNHGFARWAEGNKQELLKLGPGRHFGEWWGSGIQRGYNLPKGEKRFSLFNAVRWCEYFQEPQVRSVNPKTGESVLQDVLPRCCYRVPVISERTIFDQGVIDWSLYALKTRGSMASPGFMKPEGIVIFHTAANMAFKKTIEKDEVPKSISKIK